MKEYLQETKYLDYSSENVQSMIKKLKLDKLDQKKQTIKLFYFVRDSIRYSVHMNFVDPEIYKSSHVLQEKISFCIPKAITLASMARAISIPSRIHLVDLKNHRLTKKLIEAWGGTNIMASHSFTELYLDNKWIKATPAIDSETCKKHNFIPVEFDGENDALLHPKDTKGRLHAEYVKDHGTFADLPLEYIYKTFADTYGSLTKQRIQELSSNKVQTFK